MKFWKHTLITAFAFVGISSTVLYTACEKDSCTDLTCKNGGSCADGYCRCPTGFEGSECETKTVDRFIGEYVGITRCDNLPGLVDTLDVILHSMPNSVGLVKRSNVTDTILGIANGNTITVQDNIGDNTARYISVVLDGTRKITLYDQKVTNAAQQQKSVCTFVGQK